MKKVLTCLAILLLFNFYVSAEDYHDIVIYKLPSFAENQAKSFLSAISSDGAFYQKEGLYIFIVVLSKGYGLEMYEYKLYSLEGKAIVSKNDPNYYQWKRLFDNNISNNYSQNHLNNSNSYYSNNRNNYSSKSSNSEPYVSKYDYTPPAKGYYKPYIGLSITLAVFAGLSIGTGMVLGLIALEEDQWKGYGEGAVATTVIGFALIVPAVILEHIEKPVKNKRFSLNNISVIPTKDGMFASLQVGFKGL